MITLRAKKAKKGFSLFIDIYHNGKRQKEYLKLYVNEDYTHPNKGGGKKRIKPQDKDIWELAEKIRSQRESELKNAKYGFIASFKQNTCFVEYFENKAMSKQNHSYNGALKHLKDFAKGTISFKNVSSNFLQNFQTYLKSKVTDNTNAIYLQRLQIIWNEAIKEEITERNPFKNFTKIKTQIPKREYLTFDEIQKLAENDCSNPLIKKAFLFACFTGLRLSDCRKLKNTEIKNGNLEFRQKKSNKDILLIPLHNTAQNIIDSFSKDTDLFFDELPKSIATISKTLRAWANKAGIDKHIHFHISRHTFATLALSSNVDIYTVSKLLGHADLKQTQIYAKIIDDRKREAIAKMPEIKI